METPALHRCPICGREAPPRGAEPSNPSFPFCSSACKLVDLGRWLDGNYRVAGSPIESSLQAEAGRGEDE